MRFKFTSALLCLCSSVGIAQAPDPDIFLVSLARTGGKLAVTGARNLTNRAGYDNQPNWSRDGQTVFFTSTREDQQADIYRIAASAGSVPVRVTMTEIGRAS